ncbi:Lipopolysaccharide-induced tumor necrosis factor-alpha factor-like [Acipenser ruthenus]|uniref:Lipopolysaccharide-induced tumor necrosis factor-alpha factor-like n=1 Tax=Acipenser ruthenus TaxID=7906 RepID=A0A444UBA7_ACIRT|nr:Lipopolysaccharide-induced tumor necrosis factor-alpha factor-like [Acipenser ruthenus]
MASAPPMDATTPLTGPMPPSYDDTMKGSYPQYPPNPGYPPQGPAMGILNQPAYPVQPPHPVYPPQGPEMGKMNQPPYPGQPMQPPVTNQVVSMQTIVVQPSVIFRDQPVQMNCPACQQLIVTRLEYTSGTLTWLLCGGIAIVGCLYGCCLIPFCIDATVNVVQVQPAAVFTDRPVQLLCPGCQQSILTNMESTSGTMTYLACGALFLFGCVFGCCLIPFCVDGLKDSIHTCPNCKNVLGVHKRC